MAWSFTRSSLKTAIREAVGQKARSLTDENALIDRAVRTVAADLDLKSAKRRAILSPSLTNEHDYTLPANLKGWGIIDFNKSGKRETRQTSEWNFTTPEEFERLKRVYPNLFTVVEYDNQRFIRLAADEDDNKLLIHNMDGTASNGTWTAGGAGNSLDTSTSEDFTGSGHLVWDVDTSGTAANIQNSTLTAVNLRPYKRDRGYIYLRQYIPTTSATERAKITSFRLQFGSDSNNYYQDTATSAADGTAFKQGLNILRFNLPTGDTGQAGTPTDTAIDFVSVNLVLSSAFANEELGWRTDEIAARQGKVTEVFYYTDYMWDSGNLRASTNDSNTLMAYEQEFDLIVEKGTQLAARALRDKERADEAKQEYKDLKENYKMLYPSEAKILSTYYHFLGENEDSKLNSNLIDT